MITPMTIMFILVQFETNLEIRIGIIIYLLSVRKIVMISISIMSNKDRLAEYTSRLINIADNRLFKYFCECRHFFQKYHILNICKKFISNLIV